MEWYCGNRVNVVGVPRDHQGTWSRFPCQERWKQCGLNALNESASDSFTDECDFSCETLMDQLEMDYMLGEGDGAEISGLRGGGISESSNCWTTLLSNQDYQLHGFPPTNQTDDNFMNSMLVDDVGVNGQFGFPNSQGTYSRTNNSTRDMLLDLDDIESYEQMNAQEFQYSLDWEKKQSDTPHHNLAFMMNNAVPQCNTSTGNVEAPPPQQFCASRRVGDQPSVEETVLQEFGRVMEKMTDESRLCFRDVLYRLASYADKYLSEEGQGGEKPFTTTLVDQTCRSMEKEASELRTNTIDRTMADLMFNKPPYQYDDCRQGFSQTTQWVFRKAVFTAPHDR